MISNIKIGLLGENIAFKYLIKNGYQILYRNKRLGFDEIEEPTMWQAFILNAVQRQSVRFMQSICIKHMRPADSHLKHV